MTTPDSTQTYHDQCQQFFEKTAQQKARETKFVQKESPLNGTLFLLTMVVTAFVQGRIDLPQLAVIANRINPAVEVTGQAFKERFTDFAVTWLKAMLTEALKLSAPSGPCDLVPVLQGFTAVYLLDSSVVPLPESLKSEFPGCGGVGAKAALKLYLLLDWLTGYYETMQIETGRKADQNMGEQFLNGALKGALWLFDLGFFKCDFLAAIAKAESYFLCRLQAQVSLWRRNAEGQIESLDLDRLLRCLPRELFEIDVLVGPRQAVAARLIAAPTPREKANERRRRLRQAAAKQGRTPSQASLNRCDWTLLLTNADEKQLPTSTVVEVYRVRWQVELAFKLFKSDLRLDETIATEKNRVKCEFYAKLIALLFFNQLTGLAENLLGEKVSPTKLFRRMRFDIDAWLKALGRGRSEAIKQSLFFLADYINPSLRKKTLSTLQRLEAAAGEAQQVKLRDPLGYLRGRFKSAAEKLSAFKQRLSVHRVRFNAECAIFQRTASMP
jgi:hypothetical protein